MAPQKPEAGLVHMPEHEFDAIRMLRSLDDRERIAHTPGARSFDAAAHRMVMEFPRGAHGYERQSKRSLRRYGRASPAR